MKKFVYSFNEGSKDMKDLLGGKGANLAEMTKIGLPVPFGFTVTTEACNRYYDEGKKIGEDIVASIFEKLEEVTPLMLQKLLYFIQGVYSALYGRPIFEEDCRAWIHGPVYPEVYDLFRDFKYNPIDDARFALLDGTEDALTDDEKRVIDLVVNTFGLYGGKVLEKITHNENPWMEARKGYGDSIPSSELLPKERIMKYYILINQKYGIDTEDGLRTYIHGMLDKAS